MQPIANGKRDDGESAAVQKQPGSTKTHENYEAAILFFVHAYLILSMHLAQVNKQSFNFKQFLNTVGSLNLEVFA